MSANHTGLYIHWPFCAAKCPYCDFNSHVSANIDIEAWRSAYLTSLDYYTYLMPEITISSIYFGGGTPSLMPPDVVGDIIERMQRNWRVANDVEITLEANPTSIEADKFAGFQAAGVNRVSIGVQALNDADLRFLGREHSAREAHKALDIAGANFDRWSFDLIYARPEQTLQAWEAELRAAAALANGHLSLYQLTVERNTPFYYDHKAGKWQLPREDLAADFYHLTQDILEGAGLPAYEISNHAQAGQESVHNQGYWGYRDYIGVGPGAHGRITVNGAKHETTEHRAPQIWLEHVAEKGSGAHPFTPITREGQFEESLIMGLRQRSGFDAAAIAEQTGLALADMLNTDKLETAQSQGWLVYQDGRIICSREGLLRLNALIAYLLS